MASFLDLYNDPPSRTIQLIETVTTSNAVLSNQLGADSVPDYIVNCPTLGEALVGWARACLQTNTYHRMGAASSLSKPFLCCLSIDPQRMDVENVGALECLSGVSDVDVPFILVRLLQSIYIHHFAFWLRTKEVEKEIFLPRVLLQNSEAWAGLFFSVHLRRCRKTSMPQGRCASTLFT